MDRTNFAYLIGADEKGIRWGHPMIFFAALFLADLVFMLLYRFAFPLEFAENIISNLILAYLLLAAFQLIKNPLLATITATLLYPPLSSGFGFLTLLFTSSVSPGDYFDSLWPIVMSNALFVILFVGGVVASTHFMGRTWLALLVGAVAGRLALRLFTTIYLSLTADHQPDYSAFLFSAAAGTVFALAFWLGIRFLSEKEPFSGGADRPRLPKDFYAGTWASIGIVGFTTCLLALGAVFTQTWEGEEVNFAIALLGMIILLGVYASAVFAVLIYRMWAAIQDGHSRTTPGKALGFLFIPVFGLYWMFQVLPGFAEDYNAYVDRRDLRIEHLQKGIFTAYCVLILCGIVPVIGIVMEVVAFFTGVAIISKICDAVNALPPKGTQVPFRSPN